MNPGDTTVGFLGLGRMGLPIASRLVAAGYTVRGYDPMSEALDRAASVGVDPVPDVRTAVIGSDVVFTILPNAEAVVDVAVTEGGVGALRRGALWLELTSSRPEVTAHLARLVEEVGATLLDAPVSGGPYGAEAGTLTIMAAGAAKDLAEARPLFDSFASTIVHVGVTPGQGDATKALNNMLSSVNLTAASEALAVACALGIDPDAFVHAVGQSTGTSHALMTKIGTFALEGTFNAGFTIGQYLKDLRTAIDTAHRAGIRPALAESTLEAWSGFAAGGAGDEDHTRIVTLVMGQHGQHLTPPRAPDQPSSP